MSPEVMTGAAVSTASDIYSFGVSLWEFVTRQEAFSHHTTFTGLKTSVVQRHERPIIPDDCPVQLAGLLHRCWAPNPADRPDATTVVNELSALIEEEKIQLQWDKVVAAIPFDDGRHFWYYAFAEV
jgi:serine/threonine protein kinase